jgi:hypothetical protein
MADFWEEFRNKVLAHTTSADIANLVYQKVSTTGIAGPAIIKPAYYVGHMSVLTMDFVDHVERLLNTPDDNRSAMLRSVTFLRECGRSMIFDITQSADPLERLITLLEDVLEGEELAAMEDGELDDDDDAALDAAEAANAEAAEDQDDEEIEREALAPQREALEEAIRVKLRKGDFADNTVNEFAVSVGTVYLECVQFARELGRLSKAADEDTSTIMSILMDLQYSLDTQLRGVLLEDVDTSDLEPVYRLGFFTWSSHLVAELMEKIQAERQPASLVG